MFRVICLLIGYTFGMIQTSYIVGKLSGIDIRDHGSKSAGFTNTNRVLGIKKGAIVFFADVFKAIAAYVVATLIFINIDYSFARDVVPIPGGAFFAYDFVLPGLYAGIGAVFGHVFPFYLKFKGGKGVACALGLIIMLDWRVMLISFVVGVIAVSITRFISVASMSIMLTVPIALVVLYTGYGHVEVVALCVGLCALIWFLHRENIARLINGNENKFSFKKKKV